MMLVYVKCPEELAADRMARLNKELKELFENGEGRECRVTSLYTRVTYTYVISHNTSSLDFTKLH
jgi:hypothetical protein